MDYRRVNGVQSARTSALVEASAGVARLPLRIQKPSCGVGAMPVLVVTTMLRPSMRMNTVGGIATEISPGTVGAERS